MLCLVCSGQLKLREGKGSKGFAVHLQLTCIDCGEVHREVNTSQATARSYDVNRSVVATGLSAGLGHSGVQKLSEGLGMPGLHHKSYNEHVDAIFDKCGEVMEVILALSREKVLDYYRHNHSELFQESGVLDLPVSFDGSWPKRGHTSKLGFGAVVDVRTGLVVDFHVMSMHCQICATTGSKLEKDYPEGHKEWLNQHKATGRCTINFQGSSGAMEVEAALVLWRRSVQHQMRYTVLVRDGDTKTFLALTKANVYGDACPIRKEECVNHVAKRLNTGLRNLKSSLAKKSVRIGGNAKGSLTDPKIGLLQSYYTRAVRGHNSSVEEMSRAIWSAFFHSTNRHQDCPGGSWCWFQRDLAAGIAEPVLGARKTSTFMSEMVADHVKGVYERLTDPALLNRCLLGVTQNANESLHSLIWARCPKHLWSGYKRVFIASLLGVAEFNIGSLGSRIFLDRVGCMVTERSLQLGDRRDRKRVYKSQAAAKETAKKRKEVKKLAQQRETIRREELRVALRIYQEDFNFFFF